MKNNLMTSVLLLLSLTATVNFAQSRRGQTPNDAATKANKREPKPAATPPSATENPADAPASNNEVPLPDAPPNADGSPVVEDSEAINVSTELVTIPFKVSDRKGRFIAGLSKEDFQVAEDKVDQEIAFFTNEEQPFTVALVLDMSYSTTFKIAEIQQAAMAFVNQLRPADKVLVISFDEEVHVLCRPTNDRNVLQSAIKSTKIASGTSLYEAVDLVINKEFKRLTGRKAIVLFTDGVDTTSRRANDLNNESDALELDTLIFPVQYDTFADVQAIKNRPVSLPPTTTTNPVPSQNKNPFPFPFPGSGGGGGIGMPGSGGGIGVPGGQGTSVEDYERADEYLNEMANRTGGQLYKADSTANLAAAFSNIAGELRQYYSLGYYPKDAAKVGKRRKIKVRVNQPNLVVRARDGYVVGKKKEEK